MKPETTMERIRRERMEREEQAREVVRAEKMKRREVIWLAILIPATFVLLLVTYVYVMASVPISWW